MPYAPEQSQRNMRVWCIDTKNTDAGPALSVSIRSRATVCQRREELQQRVPDAAHGSAEGPSAEESSLRTVQEARWVAKHWLHYTHSFCEHSPRRHEIYFRTAAGQRARLLLKLSWVSGTVAPARYQSPQIQFACWPPAGVLWQHWICSYDKKILWAWPRHFAPMHIKQVCRILCTVDYYLCAKVSPGLVWWRRCIWASAIQLASVNEYVRAWVYMNIYSREYLCIFGSHYLASFLTEILEERKFRRTYWRDLISMYRAAHPPNQVG